jgi:hypothetical protein
MGRNGPRQNDQGEIVSGFILGGVAAESMGRSVRGCKDVRLRLDVFPVSIPVLPFCLDSDSEKNDPGRDGFVGISMVDGCRLVGRGVFYDDQPVGEKAAGVVGKRSVVDCCGGIGFVCFELAGAICANPHSD